MVTCARCSAEALLPERLSTWREADRLMKVRERLSLVPDVDPRDLAAITEAADMLRIAVVRKELEG